MNRARPIDVFRRIPGRPDPGFASRPESRRPAPSHYWSIPVKRIFVPIPEKIFVTPMGMVRGVEENKINASQTPSSCILKCPPRWASFGNRSS